MLQSFLHQHSARFRETSLSVRGIWLSVVVVAAVFTATVFELDAVGISVFESLHPSEFIGHEVVTMAAVLSTSLLLLVSAISLRRRIGILEIERDFLKQMVEGEPACVKLVSKDMKLLEMNPAGLNMIGAPSLDAVRGADLSEVVHPDFIGVFRELNERVFAGESRTERFRIISLDGTHRWMESHAAPLFGRDGEVTAHLAVTYDVSERMEIEQRLEASTSRLNALIDTAADGVLVLSSDGVIERLNPAATSLFEARPGENFADLIGDDNDRHGGSENFSDLVARYRRESSSELLRLSFEETGRKSSGDTFPMLVSFGEVAQGAGGGFVVTVHDLTSRLRTQAQLAQAQKMEAVGQLSGGIAHDFNNLLTVIMGNAQLLEESSEHDAPDEERLEASSMIMEAGERGVALTQRLLAFGRRQVLQPVSTQCDVLVRDMQGWLKRTLRDDISVRVRLDSGLYPIFADRSQLDTALLNLAINAQDALPHGGQLTLSAYNLTLHEEEEARALNLDPGTYVVLSVTDDGAGMSDAVKTKALEPFFTTKDVGKGTGLGLSMVYGFAKQSGGHLTIKSEQGVGTTVGIYLPADTASVTGRNNAELFSAIRRSEEHERHRGAKILVVEDDALVRAYVSRCLRSLGYQALTAHDGVEGLMLLDSVPDIDMVITDAVMPGGMSGIELSDRAAERHSGIPVVLMSGYATESLRKKGRLRPSTPFLSKPFERDALQDLVERSLDERRPSRATPAASPGFPAHLVSPDPSASSSGLMSAVQST